MMGQKALQHMRVKRSSVGIALRPYNEELKDLQTLLENIFEVGYKLGVEHGRDNEDTEDQDR